MDDRQTAGRWVSAWSTSPVDASLSETGMLDRLGVAVMDVSARTAVQLTAGGTHVRLTLSNIFGVLPLHVAACTVAIGADDARGIDPATLHTVTFGGNTHVRIGAGTTSSGRRNWTHCGWSSTPGFRARTAPPTGTSRWVLWPTPTTRTRSSPPTRPTACITPRPGSGRSPR